MSCVGTLHPGQGVGVVVKGVGTSHGVQVEVPIRVGRGEQDLVVTIETRKRGVNWA